MYTRSIGDKRMRLEQLYYLVAIAETGSFTAASEKLFIAQPSISQAIASIEKELEVTIFKRSRSGIEVTSNGKLIIDHARNILSEIEEIKKISEASDESLCTTISIGAIPAMCTMILPQVITTFKQRFPNVLIKVTEGGSKTIVKNVEKGNLDFGIVQLSDYVNWDKDNFAFHPCLISSIKAFVRRSSALAKKNTVTFEDLSNYPLVLYDEEYILHSIIKSEIEKYSPAKIMAIARNPETIKSFVMSSEAVGFGPEVSWKNHAYVRSGDICMLNINTTHKSEFGIFYRKNKSSGKATELLMKEVQNTMNSLVQE